MANPDTTTVRLATLDDVDAITRIFNHAIEHSTANFHKEAKSTDYMWR